MAKIRATGPARHLEGRRKARLHRHPLRLDLRGYLLIIGSEMFLGVQIPLSDARRFLSSDTRRLPKPVWLNPKHNREFIRGFGAMRPRLRGGIRGLDFEANYCDAAHPVRFALPLASQPLKTTMTAAVPVCVFRRFLSDGKNVARFEMGFRNKNKLRDLRGHDCVLLIEALLRLNVAVQKANAKTKRIELGQCGPELANYYARSTTEHAEAPPIQPWWVSSGRPLIVMEFTPAEVRQTSRSAFEVRRFAQDRFTLYRDHFVYQEDLVSVWLMEFDDQESINSTAARDLRICLSRLHAERECLKEILSLVAQPNCRSSMALADAAFREYLTHAVGLLVRRQYYGFEQSDILEAAQEFDALLTPGDRETLFAELGGITVGKTVLKHLEELTKPGKYSAGSITVFEAGSRQEKAMGDINKVVGQGVAGRNAHVHDVTFQQMWNQAGGNINLGKLADELSQLRDAMKKEASSRDQDRAVGEIAAAEEAARDNDGPTALERLKAAGKWALDVATKIGVGVATAALKSALGL